MGDRDQRRTVIGIGENPQLRGTRTVIGCDRLQCRENSRADMGDTMKNTGIEAEIKRLESILTLINNQKLDASRDHERSSGSKRFLRTKRGWKMKASR
jgi:hypothetical protein